MTDESPASTESSAPRRLPWELHPSLTKERLTAAARLLARGRADAIAFADPWAGDDAWSIGCRAYAFSKHQLSRAAEGGRYSWLGVLDETHHFVFLIEGMPVRFYWGDAEDPSKRTCVSRRARPSSLPWPWGAMGRMGSCSALPWRRSRTGQCGGSSSWRSAMRPGGSSAAGPYRWVKD